MPKLSVAQQELRRQKILSAAELCFTRSGFHCTSMQDICRQANVSAGSIYVYFSSKEALIEGLVERERERVLADFGQLGNVADFDTGFSLIMKNFILNLSHAKSALFLEVVAESTRNPAVRETLQRIDQSIRYAIRELLERLQANGGLAAELCIAQLVSMICSFMDGVIVRRAIDPAFEIAPLSDLLLQFVRNINNQRVLTLPIKLEHVVLEFK